MLGQPKRKGSRVASEIVYLDAIELLQTDVRHREFGLAPFAQNLPNLDFKFAHTFVGNNQKIAASAGRVEEFDFSQTNQQLAQAPDVFCTLGHLKLLVQFIQNSGQMSFMILGTEV